MKSALRVASLIVFLGFLAGCSTSDITGPDKGAVVFKVDAQTCGGTASIDLFIDGSLVGTEQMSSGSSSKAYTATAGQHIVGAHTTNATATSGRVWPSATVTVPANATYTALLTCV